MITDREFTRVWTDTLRSLRSYALWLCRDRRMIDDLVQQTGLQAWEARHNLRPDSNVRAWLFVIMRNYRYAQLRRRTREVEDPDGRFSETYAIDPGHHADKDLDDVSVAFQELPEKQQQALTHVALRGLSYADTARLCSCKEGTIKSRVARAREQLLRTVNGLPLPSRARANKSVR
ncbi:MAG TPA: sigma-70 family RNA polymerase sigma factor [Steroidobacteraceae bacterium]|nr:sigma-70 family RNA polymerase sigma factor [Steroidobacteraceae bacterium]